MPHCYSLLLSRTSPSSLLARSVCRATLRSCHTIPSTKLLTPAPAFERPALALPKLAFAPLTRPAPATAAASDDDVASWPAYSCTLAGARLQSGCGRVSERIWLRASCALASICGRINISSRPSIAAPGLSAVHQPPSPPRSPPSPPISSSSSSASSSSPPSLPCRPSLTESNGAPFTEKSPPDRWPMVAASHPTDTSLMAMRVTEHAAIVMEKREDRVTLYSCASSVRGPTSVDALCRRSPSISQTECDDTAERTSSFPPPRRRGPFLHRTSSIACSSAEPTSSAPPPTANRTEPETLKVAAAGLQGRPASM
mmetsp:Transcript_46195/g.145359  ORF Transcript_46195/g.145359 Transcript_46195/m.145359 type:complete len:313 (-) Transcript_46195:816-1754(-)